MINFMFVKYSIRTQHRIRQNSKTYLRMWEENSLGKKNRMKGTLQEGDLVISVMFANYERLFVTVTPVGEMFKTKYGRSRLT